MSVATVQFVEMVREAMNVTVSRNLYEIFCEYCGLISEHALDDRGEWEIYTCASCGNKRSYRVR